MANSPVKSSILEELMESHVFSDCRLTVQGHEFHLHKCIVCTQSPVLNAALNGNFQEAESNNLESEFEVEPIKAMVNFFYTGDYDPEACMRSEQNPEPDLTAEQRALFHLKVNAVADYYRIPDLIGLTREKLSLLPITGFPACLRVISAVVDSGDMRMQQRVADWVATKRRGILDTEAFGDLRLPEDFLLRLLRTVAECVPDCGDCYCGDCDMKRFH